MSNAEQRKNSVVNALFRGTGINFVGLIFRFALIFLQSFLAVRLYGADLFGVYIVAISAVNLLSYVGQLGFSRTGVRYIALYIERGQWGNITRFLRVMLTLTVVWSVVLGLTLYASSDYVVALFSELHLINVLLVIAIAIPCLTLATLLAAFTQGFGVMQYKVITLDMLAPALEVVLLLVFWRVGFNDIGLILSYTFSLAVVTIILGFITLRFLRRVEGEADGRLITEAIAFKPIFKFTFYAWLSLLLRHATRPINIFLIGALGTAAMVGIFSVLERLVALGVIFLMSINAMLAPMVSKLVERKDYAQLGRIYVLAARWSLAVCLPVFVFLAVFGEKILSLFGPSFVQGAPALWYLAGAWIFSLLTGPADVILMMSGRSQYSAMNQIIMIMLLVALGWWFIPIWGVIGAAAGFSVAIVIVNIIRVLQVQIFLNIHPFGMPTTKIIVAGVVMLLILLILPKIMFVSAFKLDWLGLVSVSGLGFFAYIFALFALRLEDEEVRVLNGLQKRLRLKHA